MDLRIENASPAWALMLQSGVGVTCTVGISLAALLRQELGLLPQQLARLDVTLLDGQPVDDREAALVPDGSRLALAAGLPGIAGLAMKSGSAVRALRGGITHGAAGAAHSSPAPRNGRITLALFSLALPMLAGHFLRRGVLATPEQILRYAALAPDDACLLGGSPCTAAGLPEALADASCPVMVTALLRV